MENIHYFIKWTVISVVTGTVVGLVGTVFGHSVLMITRFWQSHLWSVFLMPFAGLLIVWLYHAAHEENNRGTNTVLESVSGSEEVSAATGPLIFAATVLSHAVSASAGREGAALQLGGSIGNLFGKLFRLDDRDRKIVIMCGMSACFAALFGTPMTAGIFSLEVASIGSLYYAALVPCMFSSFIGAAIAGHAGLAPEHYEIGDVMEFGLSGAALAVALGLLCACVGILLCTALHEGGHLYKKYFPNPYVRVVAGSVIYIALTMVFSNRFYNGSGLALIERCFEQEAVPYYAFLVKILFTAVALEAGFKGGEIVPALCAGATFGYTFAALVGLPAGLCSAIGMGCLFVSVTNCPVASLLLAFELFGYEAMPYFVISIAVSFAMSGYYGLYSSQQFVFSKIRMERIDK